MNKQWPLDPSGCSQPTLDIRITSTEGNMRKLACIAYWVNTYDVTLR